MRKSAYYSCFSAQFWKLSTQHSALSTQHSALSTQHYSTLVQLSRIHQPIAGSPPVTSSDLTLPAAHPPKASKDAGLAPLLLTVVELVRQLMEAQIIRRMDEGLLSDDDIDRAAESVRKLQEQVVQICDIFEIDPADLNVDLGEVGTLLPKAGAYYPGQPTANPTILELLDRLLNSGVVLQGSVDLGLANLDLVHAKLQVVLTAKPI
jgi:hypothetical protein